MQKAVPDRGEDTPWQPIGNSGLWLLPDVPQHSSSAQHRRHTGAAPPLWQHEPPAKVMTRLQAHAVNTLLAGLHAPDAHGTALEPAIASGASPSRGRDAAGSAAAAAAAARADRAVTVRDMQLATATLEPRGLSDAAAPPHALAVTECIVRRCLQLLDRGGGDRGRASGTADEASDALPASAGDDDDDGIIGGFVVRTPEGAVGIEALHGIAQAACGWSALDAATRGQVVRWAHVCDDVDALGRLLHARGEPPYDGDVERAVAAIRSFLG